MQGCAAAFSAWQGESRSREGCRAAPSAGEKKYDIASRVVEDAFGVVMAGVCFMDYIFPEVRGSVSQVRCGITDSKHKAARAASPGGSFGGAGIFPEVRARAAGQASQASWARKGCPPRGWLQLRVASLPSCTATCGTGQEVGCGAEAPGIQPRLVRPNAAPVLMQTTWLMQGGMRMHLLQCRWRGTAS